MQDSTLPVKILDCFVHFAPRKLFDHPFQLRVFLAYDLFKLHRLPTSVRELREGPSGFDRLKLPPVADEQHTVIRMEPGLMYLPGRCQRGFVEHIKPLLPGIWLLSTYRDLSGDAPHAGHRHARARDDEGRTADLAARRHQDHS